MHKNSSPAAAAKLDVSDLIALPVDGLGELSIKELVETYLSHRDSRMQQAGAKEIERRLRAGTPAEVGEDASCSPAVGST